MDRIRDENPSYWPQGLDMSSHDEMYLIREKKANTPIGFVGLQKRTEKNDTITGYYTIGVLPEYRNQGFAKIAIQTLLKAKEPEVDQFKALIMEHNTPSINLAKSLDVEAIIKQGFIKQALIENTIKDRFKNHQKSQSLKQKEQERKYDKYKKDQEKAHAAHIQKRTDFYNSISERTRDHYQVIEDAKQQKIEAARIVQIKQEQEAYKNHIKRQELEKKTQIKLQQEQHKLETRKEQDKIKNSKDFHRDIQDTISRGLDRRIKFDDRSQKQEAIAQKQEQNVLMQKEEYEQNMQNMLPSSMKRKDNLPPIKLQFRGEPNLPMSRITVGQKKEAANAAVNHELGRMLAGAVGGGLATRYGLNPLMFGDDADIEGIEHANTLSNVILGGLLAKSKSPEKALKLALPYLGAKEVAIGIGGNTISSLKEVSHAIGPASKNMEAGAIAFKEGMTTTPMSQKLLIALVGAGLLGAGGFAAYDRFFKPKEEGADGKKDVAITIPGSKVSDHFYNNLSREMLFYSPEQKAERIMELQNDKPKRRGFFNKNTDEAPAQDEMLVDPMENMAYYDGSVKAAVNKSVATTPKPNFRYQEDELIKDPKSLFELKGSKLEPAGKYGLGETLANVAGSTVGAFATPVVEQIKGILGYAPQSDLSTASDSNYVTPETLALYSKRNTNFGLNWDAMRRSNHSSNNLIRS